MHGLGKNSQHLMGPAIGEGSLKSTKTIDCLICLTNRDFVSFL